MAPVRLSRFFNQNSKGAPKKGAFKFIKPLLLQRLCFIVFAVIFQSAVGAGGALRVTDAPSVINKIVVRLRPLGFGYGFAKPFFDFGGSISFGNPQPVRNPEHVRVDGNRVAPERNRVYDVRRFLSHARKRLQVIEIIGHFAAEFFEYVARGGKYVRRFVFIEPAGKNVFFKLLLTQPEIGRASCRERV